MERRAILAPLPAVLGLWEAARGWLVWPSWSRVASLWVSQVGCPLGWGAAVGDGNGLRGRQCSASQGWLYCWGRLRHIAQVIVSGRDRQHYNTLSVISTINNFELIHLEPIQFLELVDNKNAREMAGSGLRSGEENRKWQVGLLPRSGSCAELIAILAPS